MEVDYVTKVPSVELPDGMFLHSAASRPDLTDIIFDMNHPLIKIWPKFILMADSNADWGPIVYKTPYLAQFQLFLVKKAPTGEECVVARADSLPLYCARNPCKQGQHNLNIPGTEGALAGDLCEAYDLPTGSEAVVGQSVLQYYTRQGWPLPFEDPELCNSAGAVTTANPNVLSALQVAVDPEYRGLGMAEIMIQAMKALAKQEGLDALVVPLRPTRKAQYPEVDFAEYLRWGVDRNGHTEPFDPWLRKHVRLGGRPLRIANPSMSVRAKGAVWREWTGLNLAAIAAETSCQKHSGGREYVEVPIAGGLVPLRYYPEEDQGIYDEPNVWLIHSLI
ncbi:hypothetical protein BDV37DRAFT_278338 [Aspergillus pseudonomiae]|uniref:N-acetyltransferase domain-containing protein n=1 Tax=Aspergillus pseudonomiae TaxID=1506151 RepID=A0A5N7DSE1_9EURO|nr:uncharacterized protein BDV37DRAFT_278338 [Aspergillus pseudonomiae]KAE8409387.1 hypothetical protein BDV37DRAFT_278338 [Aspergillus pseudonomiae]